MDEVDPMCRRFKTVRPIDIVDELPRHETKTYERRSDTEIGLLVVHTTDWDTDVETVVEYDIGPNHISKTGCPGSTYHEFIMPDGTIYKALWDVEIAWHAGNHNRKSYAVALMYRCTKKGAKYNADQHAPDKNAMLSLQCRLGDLCLKYGLDPDAVRCHRELKGTGWFWQKGSKRLRKSCPGHKVDMDLLRTNVTKYMQCVLKMRKLYPGKIDGKWGIMSRRAMNEYAVDTMLEGME